MKKCLLAVLFACLAVGCRASAPTVVEYHYTVQPSGQLAASADSAETALALAQGLLKSGAQAGSDALQALVTLLQMWREQTGPGKVIPANEEALRAENKKICDARAVDQKRAEDERIEHQKAIDAADARAKAAEKRAAEDVKRANGERDRAKADLEKEKADRSLAEMWSKLFAIGLVGGVATAVFGWLSMLRPFAGFPALGAAALAAIVVVRTCAGDITIVLIITGVLAVAYCVGLYVLERIRRSKADNLVETTTDAIEALPAEVAPTVKAAVKDLAGARGVEPDLHQHLVGKGYAGT